ncbi:hypothetical protein [Pectobacterium cacticida]|uniref:hypothetical protein n=1 Tax=Pectobacterium cacticida TaxID=69221 RepID=UPI003986410F
MWQQSFVNNMSSPDAYIRAALRLLHRLGKVASRFACLIDIGKIRYISNRGSDNFLRCFASGCCSLAGIHAALDDVGLFVAQIFT